MNPKIASRLLVGIGCSAFVTAITFFVLAIWAHGESSVRFGGTGVVFMGVSVVLLLIGGALWV